MPRYPVTSPLWSESPRGTAAVAIPPEQSFFAHGSASPHLTRVGSKHDAAWVASRANRGRVALGCVPAEGTALRSSPRRANWLPFCWTATSRVKRRFCHSWRKHGRKHGESPSLVNGKMLPLSGLGGCTRPPGQVPAILSPPPSGGYPRWNLPGQGRSGTLLGTKARTLPGPRLRCGGSPHPLRRAQAVARDGPARWGHGAPGRAVRPAPGRPELRPLRGPRSGGAMPPRLRSHSPRSVAAGGAAASAGPGGGLAPGRVAHPARKKPHGGLQPRACNHLLLGPLGGSQCSPAPIDRTTLAQSLP